jgi:hypothetical protein
MKPVRRRPTERTVTYLIVGVDHTTLAPWHTNVCAGDVTTATHIAATRAETSGVDLVIAAVIGPNSIVVAHPLERRAALLNAAC